MEKQSFDDVIEILGACIYDSFPPEDSANNEIRQSINNLINCAIDGYVLVEWPESQEYMEEDWFDEEAIFCGGSEDTTGSSSYFIPIKYVV